MTGGAAVGDAPRAHAHESQIDADSRSPGRHSISHARTTVNGHHGGVAAAPGAAPAELSPGAIRRRAGAFHLLANRHDEVAWINRKAAWPAAVGALPTAGGVCHVVDRQRDRQRKGLSGPLDIGQHYAAFLDARRNEVAVLVGHSLTDELFQVERGGCAGGRLKLHYGLAR